MLMHQCHIEFRAVGPMLLAYAIFLCILIKEISWGACLWTHRDQGVLKKRSRMILLLCLVKAVNCTLCSHISFYICKVSLTRMMK